MNSLDVFESLIHGEPKSPKQEREARSSLRSPAQPVHALVRRLVDRGDTHRLRMLCGDTTPLHKMLVAESRKIRSSPPLDGALRALAALGLVLVGSDDLVEEHLAVAVNWLRHANSSMDNPLARWTCDEGDHAERLKDVAEQLRDMPYGLAVFVWLLSLRTIGVRKRHDASIDVLLDRGDQGIPARLTLGLLPGLPAGMVPDPHLMACFTADEKFLRGMITAWQTAGTANGAAVVWSVSGADGPPDRISDNSMSAAFAVLLDQTRRVSRRWTGWASLRRVASGNAIIGAVAGDGTMVGVSGYTTKMPAAKALDRVTVPKSDVDTAKSCASNTQLDVRGARTWKEASRHSGKVGRRAKLVASTVFAAFLLAVATAGGVRWWHETDDGRIKALADQVGDRAVGLSNGDDSGLAMLLAMASDDLSAEVGEQTDRFDRIARENSTLSRIITPPSGRFDDIVINDDGSYALLATDTGDAQLVSMPHGDVKWRRDAKPTIVLSESVKVTALAFADSGTLAAVATSDLVITLLERRDETWAERGKITLPVESKMSVLNTERNAVNQLSFAPDGKSVTAMGSESGMFLFSVLDVNAAPSRCPAPPLVDTLHATADRALITSEREVLEIDMATCTKRTTLTAPEGMVLHGAVASKEQFTAVATQDAQLWSLNRNGALTQIADRGPYRDVNVYLSGDGAHVSAVGRAGTYGWSVSQSLQEFGYGGAGSAVAASGMVVRLRDGIVYLQDGRHSTAAIDSTRSFGVRAVEWAGKDLVLLTGNAVHVSPDSVDTIPDKTRALDLPKNMTTVELVTTPADRWAAVLAMADGTKTRQLFVWDVRTGNRASVVLPDHQEPNHVLFVDGALYVGYLGGDLVRFELQDGNTWRVKAHQKLAKRIVALGGRNGTPDLYAVISAKNDEVPTVVAVRTADLTVLKSVDLTGASDLSGVEVLSDGQVVVGNGAGVVTFLSSALDVRGNFTDGQLQLIKDVTEVPGAGQIIVSGFAKTVTLDRATRTSLATAWSAGAPFDSAAATADGRRLATVNGRAYDLSVWTLEKPELRARMCKAIGRDLTEAEWRDLVSKDEPYRPVCA